MRMYGAVTLALFGIFSQSFTVAAFLSRSRSVHANAFSSTARFVLQEKLSSEEIHSRLEAQLSKLREKDRASKPIAVQVGTQMAGVNMSGRRNLAQIWRLICFYSCILYRI